MITAFAGNDFVSAHYFPRLTINNFEKSIDKRSAEWYNNMANEGMPLWDMCRSGGIGRRPGLKIP